MSARSPLLHLSLSINHNQLHCQWCDKLRTRDNRIEQHCVYRRIPLLLATSQWLDSVFGNTVGEAAELLLYKSTHWSCTRHNALILHRISLQHPSSMHCRSSEQPAQYL
ncbi:hypothetical protein TNCV_2606151 [Trichonephila clavipes]|nr:hypothetical protein TNCV_2606151 [Trichonephila clavipes]